MLYNSWRINRDTNDKSNGLVHAAVAKILAAYEAEQISVARYHEKVARITALTTLAATPSSYIEEAVRVSTIA